MGRFLRFRSLRAGIAWHRISARESMRSVSHRIVQAELALEMFCISVLDGRYRPHVDANRRVNGFRRKSVRWRERDWSPSEIWNHDLSSMRVLRTKRCTASLLGRPTEHGRRAQGR